MPNELRGRSILPRCREVGSVGSVVFLFVSCFRGCLGTEDAMPLELGVRGALSMEFGVVGWDTDSSA